MSTNREKLLELIENELTLQAATGTTISNVLDRHFIAECLAQKLIDDERRYRSGRRLSDRLKDKLLDLQRWVIRRD